MAEGWLSGVEGLWERFGNGRGGGVAGVAEGLQGEATEGEMGPEGAEPVDPFRGRNLHVVDALPGAEVPDDLGLEQRVQGLGQRVDAPIVVKSRTRWFEGWS